MASLQTYLWFVVSPPPPRARDGDDALGTRCEDARTTRACVTGTRHANSVPSIGVLCACCRLLHFLPWLVL
eukprot:756597-Prymnesium_polylepis.1